MATWQIDGMNNTPTRTGPGRSCTACRRRKIRCDQRRPCGYCSRRNLECIYAAPVVEASKPPADALASRLSKIELILQRIDAKISPSATVRSSPNTNDTRLNSLDESAGRNSDAPESEGRSDDGRLVNEEGDTRYVTGGFWTELGDTKEVATGVCQIDSHDPDTTSISPSNTAHALRDLLVGLTPNIGDTHSLHPPPQRILVLWHVFVSSVDPVLKVIHVPTTQQRLQSACQDLKSIPPAFESLMFAIYYSTICSMRWSVTHQTLPLEDRQTLLETYRIGLEQSLAKANFMIAPNIMIIQALTIYLISARATIDKAYIWSMTGLLIRLAMKLGLHRDPSSLDIPPFAAEIRRRVWWQIVVLDARSAEELDTERLLAEHMYATQFPANLNDSELHVGMTELPEAGPPCTDMMFTILRFHITRVAVNTIFPPRFPSGALNKSLPIPERIKVIDALENEIEEKFYRHCDESLPLVFLSRTASKLILTKFKLVIQCPPRAEIPSIPQQQLLTLVLDATEIVQAAHILRSDKRYSRWIWLFEKYIEWDTVAFLLQIMRTISSLDNVLQIWNITEAFFRYWADWVPAGERRWHLLQDLRRGAAAIHGINLSTLGTPVDQMFGPSNIDQAPAHQNDAIPVTQVHYSMSMPNDHQLLPMMDGMVQHNENFMMEQSQWFTDDVSMRNYNQNMHPIQPSGQWDMYFDDDALTTRYLNQRFPTSDPTLHG